MKSFVRKLVCKALFCLFFVVVENKEKGKDADFCIVLDNTTYIK